MNELLKKHHKQYERNGFKETWIVGIEMFADQASFAFVEQIFYVQVRVCAKMQNGTS